MDLIEIAQQWILMDRQKNVFVTDRAWTQSRPVRSGKFIFPVKVHVENLDRKLSHLPINISDMGRCCNVAIAERSRDAYRLSGMGSQYRDSTFLIENKYIVLMRVE